MSSTASPLATTCSNEQQHTGNSIPDHLISIIQIILFGTNSSTTNDDDESKLLARTTSVVRATAVIASVVLLFLYNVYSIWTANHISYYLQLWYEYFFVSIPFMTIPNAPKLISTYAMTTDENVNIGDGNTDETTKLNVPPASSGSSSGGTTTATAKNGERPSIVNPLHPNRIQCYDPSTDEYLGDVVAMTRDEVHACCQKAVIAQQSWCQTSFQQRRTVLRTIQQYIVTHANLICQVSARDSGKPIVDGYLGEILTTTEKIRTICDQGELWLLPSYRSTGIMFAYKVPRVEYNIPYGIIATIAPWNYPFHNYMNHIISGIFAGNGVVGKVSEHTSWSAVAYYSHIVKMALEVHGHNPDLVQTITGFGSAGEALVTNPLVDKIIFTGSPDIGKKVMMSASQYLKPVVLELGGKDAMVITEDVTIPNIIPWVLRGCYQNGGQNCVGVERVFVYESIYDTFIDAIVPRVQALRQGAPLSTNKNGVDCGSLVMETQIQHIQTLIDDAVHCGAKVVVGGKRNTTTGSGCGQFYEPTVIVNVTSVMKIYHEEVFGPVMTIIKVPDDDDTKCVEMINDSNFGLSSSVYCNNATRAYQKIGKYLRTGMCCINDFGSNYLIQSLPFGGVKDSGFGRFAGIEGLRALCIERSIVTDRFPGWVQTAIPKSIDYPIDPARGIPFVHSLIQLFYNDRIVEKIKAIFGLVKNG